jgi:hypothetical protein
MTWEAAVGVESDDQGGISFGKRVGEGTTEAITRIERVGAATALESKLRDVELFVTWRFADRQQFFRRVMVLFINDHLPIEDLAEHGELPSELLGLPRIV